MRLAFLLVVECSISLHVCGTLFSILCFLKLAASPGCGRLQRLEKGARAKMSAPPADLRFLKRALAVTSESTSEVVSFLEQLCNSVAETMPDVRDDTADDERDP